MDPTPIISLHDNPSLALKEAVRRSRVRPVVTNQWTGRSKSRTPVRIAVINAKQLDREGVLYFSRDKLFSMVDAAPDDIIRRRFGRAKWMAVVHIPARAVAKFENLRQFCEAYL
jgi:hypothetical protein